jgi:hypothetical protein
MARGGYQPGNAAAGDVANTAMQSGKGNYLANLVLYPGGLALCVLHSWIHTDAVLIQGWLAAVSCWLLYWSRVEFVKYLLSPALLREVCIAA